MHCANLDTLVKGTSSLLQLSQHTSSPPLNKTITESKDDEDARILKMLLDVGILVLEGRTPERTSKRGFIEGVHCVTNPQTHTHRCDFSEYMCKRMEKYRHMIESIWSENGGGLCIELRICSDCSCGEEQVWKNTMSRFDYVLEQWYFEVTNVRNGEEEDIGIMNWYGLLQAIRSQIHFSQLAAWWSSNRAQLPKNIAFHVLPLSQIDVNSCPLQHKFPVLALGTTYLQVKVRSQPRSEVLPKIHCPVHCNLDDVVDDRMQIHCDRFGKHHCQAPEDELENENWFDDVGILKTSTENSGNTMLSNNEKTQTVMKTMKYRCPVIDNRRNECCKGDRRPPTFHNKNASEFPSKTLISSSVFLRMPSHCSSSVCEQTTKLKSRALQKCDSDSSSEKCRKEELIIEQQQQQLQPFTHCHQRLNGRYRESKIHNQGLDRFEVLAETGRRSDKNREPPLQEKNSAREDAYAERDCVTQLRKLQIDVASSGRGGKRVKMKEKWNSGRQTHDLQMVSNTCSSVTDTFSKISVKLPLQNKNTPPEDNNSVCDCNVITNDKMTNSKVVNRVPTLSNNQHNNSTQERKYEKLKNISEKRPRARKFKAGFSPFAGNMVESILSGRVYFTHVVEKFKIKIMCGVSFNGQNTGTELLAASYHYHFGDSDVSKSYLVKSFISDHEKGIQMPSCGRLQVSIFNTEGSLIKVFIVPYDLSDMARCTKTYIRHNNYYAPANITKFSVKWLQSLIQLKCFCSKSGRLYLQNEINVILFQKSDLNTACELQQNVDLKHHNSTEIAYK